jgi:hypothetical protein
MICRNCGVAIPGELVPGGQWLCVTCSQQTTSSPRKARLATDGKFTDRLPPDVEPGLSGPLWLGRAYAEHIAVDLDEAPEPEVANETAAAKRLLEWQVAMPAVPSAYRPSGVLPVRAIIALTAGAGLGVVLSTPVNLAATALAFAAIAAFHFVLENVPSRWVAIAAGLLTVVAATVPFACGGWLSARTTTLSGRVGKNRNVGVAVCLAALSAGLAVATGAGLVYALGRQLLGDWLSVDVQSAGFHLLYVSGAAMAATIAMGTAVHFAAKRVRAEKFCEDCEVFMSGQKLKSLHLGAVRAVARGLHEHNTEVVTSLLHSPTGSDGTVDAYRCPRCGKGVVEVTVRFDARWRVPDRGRKKESWLVASVELPNAEMDRFTAPRSQGGAEAGPVHLA